MDFTPTETQAAVRGVVTDVLDRDASGWKALASAGLLGLAVPERYGGEGLGLDEVGVVLHEIGRRARPLPAWETLVCSGLTLAEHGTDAQQQTLFPDLLAGECVLAPALGEPGGGPRRPRTTIRRDHGRWLLFGRKTGVSHADEAHRLLVPATVDDTRGAARAVVLLDPRSAGVTVTPTRASRGAVEATVEMSDVEVAEDDVLGGWARTEEAVHTLHRLAVAGLCLLGDGLVAGARDLTAGYVRDRRQFGRALAEFQAVSQQMADVYIASRTIGLTATSAAWRLSHGLTADDDLAVAAYWFTAEAPAALHTCHHLHGGMGVDVTYPLHRYYSWTKDVVRALGGTHETLGQVADRLVAAEGR